MFSRDISFFFFFFFLTWHEWNLVTRPVGVGGVSRKHAVGKNGDIQGQLLSVPCAKRPGHFLWPYLARLKRILACSECAFTQRLHCLCDILTATAPFSVRGCSIYKLTFSNIEVIHGGRIFTADLPYVEVIQTLRNISTAYMAEHHSKTKVIGPTFCMHGCLPWLTR